MRVGGISAPVVAKWTQRQDSNHASKGVLALGAALSVFTDELRLLLADTACLTTKEGNSCSSTIKTSNQ